MRQLINDAGSRRKAGGRQEEGMQAGVRHKAWQGDGEAAVGDKTLLLIFVCRAVIEFICLVFVFVDLPRPPLPPLQLPLPLFGHFRSLFGCCMFPLIKCALTWQKSKNVDIINYKIGRGDEQGAWQAKKKNKESQNERNINCGRSAAENCQESH